jgi:hypothetical protein
LRLHTERERERERERKREREREREIEREDILFTVEPRVNPHVGKAPTFAREG